MTKEVYVPSSIAKLEHFQNLSTNRSGYLKGLALDCYENPSNDRNSHYFGRELLWTGRPHSAIKELERHIAMNAWQPERSQSAIFIGDAWSALQNESEAVRWYHKAYEIESRRREPLIRLAELYWRKDDAQRTAAYATAALTIKQDGFYANNAAHYRHVPHELLFWALWQLGDRVEAARHFELALAYCPTNPKLLHDARFFRDLPVVSVVLPQLGREESFKRAVKSIEELNYPKEKIELLIEDGPDTVPNKVDRLYKQSKGEWVVFASNDIEFTPDSLMIALTQGTKGLRAFNTGEVLPDKGNINEHFMIKRELVEKIGGQIFSTRYKHVGVDNLLWAQCDRLGEAERIDQAIVIHHHFSTGKSTFDDVYKKGWSSADEDRARLKKDLAQLALQPV